MSLSCKSESSLKSLITAGTAVYIVFPWSKITLISAFVHMERKKNIMNTLALAEKLMKAIQKQSGVWSQEINNKLVGYID